MKSETKKAAADKQSENLWKNEKRKETLGPVHTWSESRCWITSLSLSLFQSTKKKFRLENAGSWPRSRDCQ